MITIDINNEIISAVILELEEAKKLINSDNKAKANQKIDVALYAIKEKLNKIEFSKN